MSIDTRGEDNPLWVLGEELSADKEDEARFHYIEENLELVNVGVQSGFVGWFDTTRGVRDIYREKVKNSAQEVNHVH